MKKILFVEIRTSLTIVLLFFFFLYNSFSISPLQELEKIKKPSFIEIKQAYDRYWDSVPKEARSGWKQYQRWKYFWEPRTLATGDFPDEIQILNEYKRHIEVNKFDKLQSDKVWELVGPINIPPGLSDQIREQGLGKVNVLRIHPNNYNDLWAGSATGGVWRSTDGGKTWKNFPNTHILSLGVADIAIAPSNPNVIYVATGDHEPACGRGFYSVGLIKTTNLGETWSLTNLAYQFSEGKNITRVLVHPQNADIVICASNEGILKSTDGGNSWRNVLSGRYFFDMEYKPNDFNVLYASTFSWGGTNYIYKSTDMGETWKIVQTLTNCIRIALNVTPARPNNVYALNVNRQRAFHSFIVSEDAGENWELYALTETVGNILGRDKGRGSDSTVGQGEYDLCLAISPLNPDLIFSGGINIWKSNDGGSIWELNAHWVGGYGKPLVHADHHDMIFQPNSNIVYSANDGGVNKSTNLGVEWINLSDGLSITQFYRLSTCEAYPGMITAGAQDNGTSMFKDGEWKHIYSGDGMETIIDPTNPNRIYVCLPYGYILRSNNGGSTFVPVMGDFITGGDGNWVTPYCLNPQKPSTMFAGYSDVWKSTNHGTSWTKISNFSSSRTIVALAVAPSDSNTIYAATYNTLYATTNGGSNWSMIYSSSNAISYIAVHPENPRRIWISLMGYSSNNKVMEWNGTSWRDISGNLPNVPVNCIVYQKNSPDRLYVGTDLGTYYTDYNSAFWLPYGAGMPNIIVNELEINYASNKLVAATYGRGVWQIDLNTCNLPPIEIKLVGEREFCKGKSATLIAPDGYSAYLWNTGETTKSIEVVSSGIYSVTVFDKDGCSVKSEGVEINVLPVPELKIQSVGKACLCGEQDSVILNASFGFVKYRWAHGDSTRRVTVYAEGKYSVEATASNNCIANAEFLVERFPNPAKPEITRDLNWLIAPEAVSYQWFLNGQPISGATQRTYLAKEDGYYQVRIWDANGCSNISDSLDFVLGIEDNVEEFQQILVFPNPSEGLFSISFLNDRFEPVIFSVLNLMGEEICKSNVSNAESNCNFKVDISNQPRGVYFVQISVGNKVYVKKIIKK